VAHDRAFRVIGSTAIARIGTGKSPWVSSMLRSRSDSPVVRAHSAIAVFRDESLAPLPRQIGGMPTTRPNGSGHILESRRAYKGTRVVRIEPGVLSCGSKRPAYDPRMSTKDGQTPTVGHGRNDIIRAADMEDVRPDSHRYAVINPNRCGLIQMLLALICCGSLSWL
jgi:hypothetical protein